jgi:hypothetical protein
MTTHVSAERTETKPAIRLAVLGDSDSHSYQDRYSFPPGSPARGGAYRVSTLQWTEVLIGLRLKSIDLGPWGEWGQRRPLAQMLDWLGMESRTPKKEDFLYNLAASGAGCNDLMSGIYRQAPRLADLMRPQPDAWRGAIIVIKMGINDIGNYSMLKLMAQDPSSPVVRERSLNCANRIEETILFLRKIQPKIRFVLVSPFNDNDDPGNLAEWNSALEQANLKKGFMHLDNSLRTITTKNQSVHYMNDGEWFHMRWGSRDANGKPNYQTVHIAGVIDVTNTAGDEPTNAVLNDHHAGLVWNTLWAQALVNEINDAWMVGIPAITDGEAAEFIKRRLALGPAFKQTPAAAR